MNLDEINPQLEATMDERESALVFLDALAQKWIWYQEDDYLEPLVSLATRFLSNHALSPSIAGTTFAFVPVQKLRWNINPKELWVGFFFVNGLILKSFQGEKTTSLHLVVRPDTASTWGYPLTQEEYSVLK